MKPTMILAATIALAAPTTAFAHPADSAINSVYSGLSAARRAGNVEGMSAAFAADALLIDQRPNPALRGSDLPAQIRPMAARLQADQAQLDTAYRIERRSVTGDIAIDVGFMRQTLVRPNVEPNIRFARFMVTMRRGADGRWMIIGDAAMPAQGAAWTALTRSEGLHYDG